MKDISLGKEFYVSIFFLNFRTLKILFHCHLTYIVSSENPVVTLTFIPLSFSPGCSVGFLFAVGSKQFDYHVHWFTVHVFLHYTKCMYNSLLKLSHSSLILSFSPFQSFCPLFHFEVSTIVSSSFIFSSTIYNLPLIPSSVFFTLDIVFTSSSSIQVFSDYFPCVYLVCSTFYVAF